MGKNKKVQKLLINKSGNIKYRIIWCKVGNGE